MLRLVEGVHAVDVGFQRPRQEFGAPGGPKRWSEKSNTRRDEKREDDSLSPCQCRGGRGCEPAKNAHQHDGNAEDVENVDAQKIRPGNPFVTEGVFLNAEQQPEPENFRAAKNGLPGDLSRGNSLLPELFGDQRNGYAGEENEKRSRQSPAELGEFVQLRIVEFGSEPRIVAVGLEHEKASQTAHPVNVRKAFQGLRSSLV